MEFEQRGRLDECAKFRNPARIHKQRGQAEYDPIERGQIRCSSSGSIGDQKLMFEQKRLCGDGADATGAKELRDGDQQVDGEDQDFTHGVNATMVASACKTAPRGRIASHYDFATHRLALGRLTIADVGCFPYVALAPEGGISLEVFPGVRKWIERIKKQPGFVPMPGI